MKNEEFSEKNIEELTRTINYYLQEQEEIEGSKKFVSTITICSFVSALLALGITISLESLEFLLVSLGSGVSFVTWGASNYYKLNKLLKENRETINMALDERYKYITNHSKAIEKEQKLAQEKEEEQKLFATKIAIYGVSPLIKPELFLEWVALATLINEFSPRLCQTIINDFYELHKQNYNISDEYFSYKGLNYNISSILSHFSVDSYPYKEYLQKVANLKVEIYTPLSTYENNQNFPMIAYDKIAEYMVFTNELKKSESGLKMLMVLNKALEIAFKGDFSQLSYQYFFLNEQSYSIMDIVIYFSSNSASLQEYLNSEKRSRIKKPSQAGVNLTR